MRVARWLLKTSIDTAMPVDRSQGVDAVEPLRTSYKGSRTVLRDAPARLAVAGRAGGRFITIAQIWHRIAIVTWGTI